MLPTGPGAVLELIRTGRATTRGELIAHLGWSRVTLGRRLDELVGAGLIVSGGQLDSSGGRPPERLAVNKDAGVLLALDIGGSHTRIGLTDLVSNVLEEDEADIGNEDGPDDIFEWALQVWDFLLARVGRTRADVRGIGIGVPGPVDPRTGELGAGQPDRRWEGVRVSRYFEGFDAVFALDRDVNVHAVAESRVGWPTYSDLLVVKAGIGLSCAIVSGGRIVRGARGGAGQLSAPRTGVDQPLRELQVTASGAVVRDRLARDGIAARTSAEIVALAQSGDRTTEEALVEMGTSLGSALAEVVGILNPEAVIIGGNLADAGDRFLSAVRAELLGTALPYARRGLVIEKSRLGDRAGVRGAALIAQDALFDADRVDRLMAERTERADRSVGAEA